jgi:two-component system, chemotaxis family, chemotaxis protein CheY
LSTTPALDNLREIIERTMSANPLSILIADDSDAMRAFLHDLVKDRSFAVFEAQDGREAVLMYNSLRPDLVIMDVRMPNMDGIRATKAILSIDPTASVVIVTDKSPAAYRSEALKAGARAFILKENLHELLDFIPDDNRRD